MLVLNVVLVLVLVLNVVLVLVLVLNVVLVRPFYERGALISPRVCVPGPCVIFSCF